MSPLPEQFGRYRILQLLGQGGMGSVYLARDTSLDRDVALKVPALDGPNTAQMIERFSREARAAATLHHPNICPVYDVGEIDGHPYLTMRYIQGRPLSEFISPALTQNPWNVAAIVRKLALALAEAHKQGIVHRDLKPANIMIDSRNEPIVMDFGLARQIGRANEKQITQSGMIVGTPAYMSPEQISGDPSQIDHRTDVWSLGVILFEMLTGQLPFDGSVLQIVGAILHVEPPRASKTRPALPEGISSICRRMMTRDKTQRCQSMKGAAAELAVFLEDASVGSLTVGSTFPSGLELIAIGTSVETQTPRSPLDAMAAGGPTGTTVLAATPGNGGVIGAFAALMNWIRQSSSTLLHGPGHVKKPIGHRSIRVWMVPAAVLAGMLIIIGGLDAVSDRNGKPTAAKNDAPTTADKALPSVPQASSADPQPSQGWHGWPANAAKPAIAPFDAEEAGRHQNEWAVYLKVPVEFENSIGMKFRLIPPGEFMMGSTPEEIAKPFEDVKTEAGSAANAVRSELPRHRVILTRPFYLSVTEVTQSQYLRVVGTNPSSMAVTGNFSERVKGVDTSSFPVESINWYDAKQFCVDLGLRERESKDFTSPFANHAIEYRLPTEAEWEFACRAGSVTKFWIGDDEESLAKCGWPNGNLHNVGLLAANPFGLHDVHGNAMEWVLDPWDPSYYGQFIDQPAVDPQGTTTPTLERLVRGGGWTGFISGMRSSARFINPAYSKYYGFGIRVAVSIETDSPGQRRVSPAD